MKTLQTDQYNNKKMNVKIMSLYVVILWTAFGGIPIRFERIAECMLESSKGCIKWKNQLFFYSKETQSCVPGSMRVLTREDKTKLMEEVSVGDEVLSYNPLTQNLEYRPVIGWLHRSPGGVFEYLRIPIGESFILVSAKHNLAMKWKNSTSPIYTFAQHLEFEDDLILFSRNQQLQTITNTKANKIVADRGLYAPYVKGNMNYFILDEGMQSMILLHCFANVNVNPFPFYSLPSIHDYFPYFDKAMTVSWYLGLNKEPKSQSYLHPLVQILSGMFGSVIDWSEEKYQVINHEKGYIKVRHYGTFREFSLAEEQPEFFRHDKEMVIFLESFFSQRYLY